MDKAQNPDDALAPNGYGENATSACPETGENSGPRSDQETGYCKPPKATQWKKGQSGNPTGKKKKPTATLKDAFLKCAGKSISMVDASGKHQTTQFEAVMVVFFQKALKGDLKAIKMIMEFAEKHIKPAHATLNDLADQVSDLGGAILYPKEVEALFGLKKLYGGSEPLGSHEDDAP
jgi:hypothetical protein